MTPVKQPNNNAIAFLIGLNILVSLLSLISSQNPKVDNIAYANHEVIEPARKGYRDSDIEEAMEKENILFKVESVVSESADGNTVPLYFSHADEHGSYFTYTQTEQPKDWEQGYWYIDHGILENANIIPLLLNHNDVIQGVYYPNEYGDLFEIKKVVATPKSNQSNQHVK